MKKHLTLVLLISTVGFANNPDIDACLSHWKSHPFKKQGYEFRALRSNVKVLGIGGNVIDAESTTKPALVLVKTSVNVMSKQSYELMNPNGWYCIKGSVTVLGKAHIKAHCKAHVIMTDDGATVLGDNQETNGVTVLGKVELERIGCEPKRENE